MALTPQFLGGVGTAMKDLLIANVASAVASVDINIFGIHLQPFAFLQQWADDLVNQANQAIADASAAQIAADTANSGVSTVASGVTANITGSSSSSNPADVGNSIGILNNTVQSSSQPPQTVIVTTTQDVPIPTGCRTVVMNVFGPSGGGARGGNSGGSGLAGGPSGIGGWQKDISMQASVMTSTLHCVIGTKGLGATSDTTAGADGNGSSYVASADGSVKYCEATAGKGGKPMTTASSSPDWSSLTGAAGSGNGVQTVPGKSGGHGGIRNLFNATDGANGLNVSGGTAGASAGSAGGNGSDDTSTLTPGNGGSGGGGAPGGATGNAGKGGNGGHPGGAAGGGGAFYAVGSNGNGGDGADGEIWLKFVF
ncbi:hypothetical protein B7C42_01655 [Nocardia cerradoensis]|uniref:Glycine-rich domain-containing protein n=1 Tax=Nocardia cerradoensis TaxID=85688 RepID=A0A231HCQ5_9NOCA|nr:hypothetical protein [Nocardia cerradoensis]OXR46680.1 hypothetical protein B7C42_01655 [Nocardia cerradoensis]